MKNSTLINFTFESFHLHLCSVRLLFATTVSAASVSIATVADSLNARALALGDKFIIFGMKSDRGNQQWKTRRKKRIANVSHDFHCFSHCVLLARMPCANSIKKKNVCFRLTAPAAGFNYKRFHLPASRRWYGFAGATINIVRFI